MLKEGIIEQQPGTLNRLRSKVAAGMLAVGLLGTGATAPEVAQAEINPNIVIIDENNTTGDLVTTMKNPDLNIEGDIPYAVFISGRDVMLLRGGDSSFVDGNKMLTVHTGAGSGYKPDASIIDVNGEKTIFYTTQFGAEAANCLDNCDNWITHELMPKVGAIDGSVSPSGKIGIAYSKVVDGRASELHYREYDNNSFENYSDELIAEGFTDVDIELMYGENGQKVIVYRDGGDTMVAVKDGEVWNTTAVDTSRDTGRNLSVTLTPDGYRAAYQAAEYDETGNYVGPVTRVGSAYVAEDEESSSSGSISGTVVTYNSGHGTSIQKLSNGNIATVQGSDEGLVIAECVSETEDQGTPDCTSYSYQAKLDESGKVNGVAYRVGEQGGIALYSIESAFGSALRAITSPLETFINLREEGEQQQAANHQRAMSSTPNGLSDTNPPLPNLNGLQFTYDLRYVVGKKVVDACLAATNDPATCDKIWHPTQP